MAISEGFLVSFSGLFGNEFSNEIEVMDSLLFKSLGGLLKLLASFCSKLLSKFSPDFSAIF